MDTKNINEYHIWLNKKNKEFSPYALTLRLKNVNKDIKEKGFYYNRRYNETYLTGYDYLQFYDWDLYFENIYALYNGVDEFCFSNLNQFFRLQKKNGFIKRSFGSKPYGIFQPFKPFISQIILLGCNARKDYSYAQEHFQQIEKYVAYYYQKYDRNNNLLCCWKNADASGMDNQTSRILSGSRCEGVDLNCYLYREYIALALLYEKCSMDAQKEKCIRKANNIKKAINENLWDNESGFYYDFDTKNKKLNKVKSISGFVPLWAGIATQEQAKRLIEEHLNNPQEFLTEYPIPSLSLDSKAYCQKGYNPPSGLCNWNGPMWIPMNYMIFHGLMNYGYNDEAEKIALKTFEAVLFKNKVTREYYNAITGEGYGRNPFWGWSVLAYFMPLEFYLKYDPTKLSYSPVEPMANIIFEEKH